MSSMFGKTPTDQSYRNTGVGNTLVADQVVARSITFTETNYINAVNPNLNIETEEIKCNQRLRDLGPSGYYRFGHTLIPGIIPVLEKRLIRMMALTSRKHNSGTFSVGYRDSNGDFSSIINNAECKNSHNGVSCSSIKYESGSFGDSGTICEPEIIPPDSQFEVITDNPDFSDCEIILKCFNSE